MWERTVSPLLSGVDRRRRCVPGTGCVKAVQVHRGDLSSGSGRKEGRRHVTGGRGVHFHLEAHFMVMNFKKKRKRESAVIHRAVRCARPSCRTKAGSTEEQIAQMSSFMGLFNITRQLFLNIPYPVLEKMETKTPQVVTALQNNG